MRRVGRDPACRTGAPGRGPRLSVDSDWLHELFEPIGPIAVRRMFGGAGVYRDGLMFGLVSDGEVFLKTDDQTVPRFREAGCRPFSYSKGGKVTVMSYWSLPADALDDPQTLKEWAELAFQSALDKAERTKRGRSGSRARGNPRGRKHDARQDQS